MKNLLLFGLVLLASCGKHRDGTSVWAEGLWLVVALPLIGAVIFLISGYRSSKSGSHQQQEQKPDPKNPGGYITTPGNVSFFSTWQFKFGAALLIATAVIIFLVNRGKG